MPANTTSGTAPSKVLLAALEYVEIGWPVFPCNPLDKRPLTTHGFKDATLDPNIVRSWWQQWPNAMIGVPMGSRSGVFCVDLDRKEGGHDGVLTWAGLTAKHGNVATRMHITPSTGMHAIFIYQDGIRNIPLNKLAPGIEIKGEGGYIVVPPSQMANGKQYTSNDMEIGLVPGWLIFMIFSYLSRDEDFERELAQDAGKGTFKEESRSYGPTDPEEVREALSHIPSDDYDIWFRIAGAIRKELGESGYRLFEEWSRKSKKFSIKDCLRKWKDASDIKSISAGTIFKLANEHAPNWQEKWRARNKQQAKPEQKSEKPKSGIKLFNLFPVIEENLPTRPWIIPGLLLRGHLTMTAAPGATGKSILTICVSVILAMGTQWAGWTPRQRCKVLIINVEEDKEELCRRACAIASKMGFQNGDLKNYIKAAEDPEKIIIAEYNSKLRTMVKQPLVDEIVKLIQAEKFDVVIVDPFAETFTGEETNTELKWVGAMWREVARKTKCAIWLIHHTKKYASDMAGDVDAARGGTALGNVIRIATTMFVMTKEEALTMGISEEDRISYVRFDDAKANYNLVSFKAQWFRKETVLLQNQHGDIPGDNVGVLVPWTMPTTFEGVAPEDIQRLLAEIDLGMRDNAGNFLGEYYTLHNKQRATDEFNRWVGLLVGKKLNKEDKLVRLILQEWRKANVLVEFQYRTTSRKWRSGCGSMSKKMEMEALPEAQNRIFKEGEKS